MEVFLKTSASQQQEQHIPDLGRDGTTFRNPPGVPQVPLFVQLLQNWVFKAVKERVSLLWSPWCHDWRCSDPDWQRW